METNNRELGQFNRYKIAFDSKINKEIRVLQELSIINIWDQK